MDDADVWWHGLPAERREQIHRWVTQRRHAPHVDGQVDALDLLPDLPTTEEHR